MIGARQAQIGPQQRRIAVGEQPARHEAGGGRNAEPFAECGGLVLEGVAAHLDAEHQHRFVGGGEGGQDLARARLDGLAVDRRCLVGRHGVDRNTDHVARQLQIDRAGEVPGGTQDPGDLGRCGVGIVEDRLGAGHLLIDPVLGPEMLDLVVQVQPDRPLRRAGRARDHDHRRLLGIGLGHRVDHVQPAGTIGDRRHPQGRMEPRGGIGGKADAGLVAQRVQRQDPRAFDLLEEGQGEVTGNAEDLLGTVRLERGQQGVGKRQLGHLICPDGGCTVHSIQIAHPQGCSRPPAEPTGPRRLGASAVLPDCVSDRR